jgi:hypothetical protein
MCETNFALECLKDKDARFGRSEVDKWEAHARFKRFWTTRPSVCNEMRVRARTYNHSTHTQHLSARCARSDTAQKGYLYNFLIPIHPSRGVLKMTIRISDYLNTHTCTYSMHKVSRSVSHVHASGRTAAADGWALRLPPAEKNSHSSVITRW